MKRYLVALFVAFMLHFLLFASLYFFFQQEPKNEKIKQQEHKVRVYLKNPTIKKDKKVGIKKLKPKKKKRVAPPKQQKSVKKEKVFKKQSKTKPTKKIKKIKPKKIQTKKLKKQPQKVEKKLPLKKVEKTVQKQNDPLAWMYQDYAPQQTQPKKQNNNLSQNIQDLYGEKFAELTKGQQQYILDNQEIMRRITQGVLERVASVNLPRDLRVNKTNTIEFYLYPDGHISDFKFLEKSGVFILDETTRETIEYAYAKYPRPKEKTLIRYRVFYQLRF